MSRTLSTIYAILCRLTAATALIGPPCEVCAAAAVANIPSCFACFFLFAAAFRRFLILVLFLLLEHVGGNQREVDRQRAQKRAEKTTGSKKKKGTGNASQALTNKKEHDAEIMRQKQQRALDKKPVTKVAKGTNVLAKSK